MIDEPGDEKEQRESTRMIGRDSHESARDDEYGRVDDEQVETVVKKWWR